MGYNNSSQNSLLRNTLIITIFSLVGKIAGALFKIPLTNIIGAVGMGYYQMVFPLFVLLFSLSSGGIATALTINVADRDCGYKKQITKFAFAITLCVALTLSAILVVFSRNLAILQGNKEVAVIYLSVAIAVIFVSILSVIRGMVRGKERFTQFAFSEIIEQITKVGFALVLALFLKKYGTQYSVVGVFAGIIISTIFSGIYLLCDIKKNKYLFQCKSNSTFNGDCNDSNFAKFCFGFNEKKEFIVLSIILCAVALIVPATQFVDSILVVNILKGHGETAEVATALFGLSRGTVASLLNLPAVAIVSLEFVLLPNMLQCAKNKYQISHKVNLSFIIVAIVASPFMFAYLFFAEPIIQLLYGGGLSELEISVAVDLLKIGSFSVLFSGLLQISTVCMQGAKMYNKPVISLLLAAVLKIIFLLVFLPRIGIFAAEISNVLFYAIATVSNLIILYSQDIDVRCRWFFVPIILVFAMAIVAKYLYSIMISSVGVALSLVIVGFVSAIFYGLIILLLFKKILISKKYTV